MASGHDATASEMVRAALQLLVGYNGQVQGRDIRLGPSVDV